MLTKIAPRRAAALLTAAVLALGGVTACSSDNVDCGIEMCTVTIQRETNASASVLGIEAKFVSADQNTVTMEIAGEQIQLVKGQQATQVGGLFVLLDSVTQDQIVLKISR